MLESPYMSVSQIAAEVGFGVLLIYW